MDNYNTDIINPEAAKSLSFSLSEEAFGIMKAHLEKDFPKEGCGFLFGYENESGRVISIAQPTENVKEGDQRRRFEISPLAYVRAEQFALDNDLSLLGIYHSHPNHPAIASVHDHKSAAPFFSYIILSIQEGSFDHIRSWRLEESDRFAEEDIQHISNTVHS